LPHIQIQCLCNTCNTMTSQPRTCNTKTSPPHIAIFPCPQNSPHKKNWVSPCVRCVFALLPSSFVTHCACVCVCVCVCVCRRRRSRNPASRSRPSSLSTDAHLKWPTPTASIGMSRMASLGTRRYPPPHMTHTHPPTASIGMYPPPHMAHSSSYDSYDSAPLLECQEWHLSRPGGV
jgi:hypothetical protein